jgi:hypothetical protein
VQANLYTVGRNGRVEAGREEEVVTYGPVRSQKKIAFREAS